MARQTVRSLAVPAAGAAVIAAGVATAIPDGPPEYRSIDGTGNNLLHPEWGSVGSQLLRLSTVSYGDGISEPAGGNRPSPRVISNAVCAQDSLRPNAVAASDYLWQWGQFIDHDITLVDPAEPAEPFNIPVPAWDPFFDPQGTGTQVILLDRSAYDLTTGTHPGNPRQQVGSITTFIDASQVYGSDEVRADELRTLDGTGRLKTSPGNLLPFNVNGLPNLGGPDPTLFLAGDIRANEQVALTCMHTLFVREHNRIADEIAGANPQLTGEEIYQQARAIVGAEIQVITYSEFLPLLLGPDALAPYSGYSDQVNPGIANFFATAAYRVGHTLLSPVIRRLDANGEPLVWGHLPLREAFFAPQRIIDEGGIAPTLRGLASQAAQDVDTLIIDDVRNFLFGAPGQGGFDLPSLNLQRGRDHGLPSYTQARIDAGLPPVTRFQQITSDPHVRHALAFVYRDVDEVDLWVGALAEDHVSGAMVGPLLRTIISDQFTRLRDGDRFWYENVFSGPELEALRSVRLSDVIRWNTEISSEIPDDVFHVPAVCTGDINGDGVVNVLDVIEVLAAWGQTNHPADVNGDGIVDILDLIIVLLNLGPCA